MLNFATPRTFALARALGLALPLPRAFAQAQAPAAAPAPAPGLGAEQVDLGRQLIVATGLQVNFPNTVIAMMEQVGRTLLRTRPELAEPLRAVLLANEADFLKEAEPMLEIASKIVASRMTGQELKDAIAFFNSPSPIPPATLPHMQNLITDVPGVLVGNAQDEKLASGGDHSRVARIPHEHSGVGPQPAVGLIAASAVEVERDLHFRR